MDPRCYVFVLELAAPFLQRDAKTGKAVAPFGGRFGPTPKTSRAVVTFRAGAKAEARLREMAPYCGWTKSISHHFEAVVETITFVGVYSGILILRFLRWCRISSIHSIRPLHPAAQASISHGPPRCLIRQASCKANPVTQTFSDLFRAPFN